MEFSSNWNFYILGQSEDDTYIGDFVELYDNEDDDAYMEFVEVVDEEQLDYVDYGRVKVMQKGLMKPQN